MAAIVLPDFHLDLIKHRRRGPVYASVPDLIGLLYKAAADPQQHPVAAEAFKHLAEAFEADVIEPYS